MVERLFRRQVSIAPLVLDVNDNTLAIPDEVNRVQ